MVYDGYSQSVGRPIIIATRHMLRPPLDRHATCCDPWCTMVTCRWYVRSSSRRTTCCDPPRPARHMLRPPSTGTPHAATLIDRQVRGTIDPLLCRRAPPADRRGRAALARALPRARDAAAARLVPRVPHAARPLARRALRPRLPPGPGVGTPTRALLESPRALRARARSSSERLVVAPRRVRVSATTASTSSPASSPRRVSCSGSFECATPPARSLAARRVHRRWV